MLQLQLLGITGFGALLKLFWVGVSGARYNRKENLSTHSYRKISFLVSKNTYARFSYNFHKIVLENSLKLQLYSSILVVVSIVFGPVFSSVLGH